MATYKHPNGRRCEAKTSTSCPYFQGETLSKENLLTKKVTAASNYHEYDYAKKELDNFRKTDDYVAVKKTQQRAEAKAKEILSPFADAVTGNSRDLQRSNYSIYIDKDSHDERYIQYLHAVKHERQAHNLMIAKQAQRILEGKDTLFTKYDKEVNPGAVHYKNSDVSFNNWKPSSYNQDNAVKQLVFLYLKAKDTAYQNNRMTISPEEKAGQGIYNDESEYPFRSSYRERSDRYNYIQPGERDRVEILAGLIKKAQTYPFPPSGTAREAMQKFLSENEKTLRTAGDIRNSKGQGYSFQEYGEADYIRKISNSYFTPVS